MKIDKTRKIVTEILSEYIDIDEKKNQVINFRVTQSQKSKIEKQAKLYGLNVSSYIMMLVCRDGWE